MASKSLAIVEGGQVSAPQPRSLAEIIADLSQPIAPEDLQQKKRGDATLSFIPWYRAIKYLDHYAPGWKSEVRSVVWFEGRIVLTVRLTIVAAEGETWREATGTEEEPDEGEHMYGDPSSNAESMALRRAAAKFGLGLSLYEKGNGASGVRDPKPKTLGDLVTPKQLWMIRNMGREIGCDVEKECRGQLGLGLEEISKRAASSFIDYLKRIGEEGGEDEKETTTPADTLLALNKRLGFDDEQLLRWLRTKFRVDKGLTLNETLNSLGKGEMSQALDIFQQKLEESS